MYKERHVKEALLLFNVWLSNKLFWKYGNTNYFDNQNKIKEIFGDNLLQNSQNTKKERKE